MVSVSVQDYLQTIYRLQQAESPVATMALAGQLGVAPASVTGMVQKLHRVGLVEHVPYRGVVLTEDGRQEAVRLLRRHRLWELFLTDVLGLSWDEVHEEAHRLEHATSDRVADRLAAFLREPEADPHGQPIPGRSGSFPVRRSVTLLELQSGRAARVVEVPDGDAALLRRLARWGMVPGATVTVLDQPGPAGTIWVESGGESQILERKIAAAVRVDPAAGD